MSDTNTGIEIVNGEQFLQDVSSVEAEHSFIRQRAQDARSKIEESYWDLSVVLHEIYTDMLYQSWGFKSWADYVEIEMGMNKRKAQYLVSIQSWFGEMKPSVQRWVRELGWTKAKELVGRVDNENAEEWQEKVEGKSYRELMNLLEESKGSGTEGEPEVPNVEEPKPTKMNFALFEDQLSNVESALKVAKEISQSDSNNHALDMICLEFISTHQMSTVQEYLAKVEAILGVKLIGYDAKDDAIVFGSDTLDSLVESDED